MRVLLLLSLMIINLSCSEFTGAPGLYASDPELQPFVDRYLDLKLERTGSGSLAYRITVGFDDLPLGTIGLCTQTDFESWAGQVVSYRDIAVDLDTWGYMTEAEKLQVILHELGHCDLDLDHGGGGAIMDPTQMSDITFISNFDVLVDSLFAGW